MNLPRMNLPSYVCVFKSCVIFVSDEIHYISINDINNNSGINNNNNKEQLQQIKTVWHFPGR